MQISRARGAKGKLKMLVRRLTSFLLSFRLRPVISLCLSPCGISRAAVQSLKVRNCKIRANNALRRVINSSRRHADSFSSLSAARESSGAFCSDKNHYPLY